MNPGNAADEPDTGLSLGLGNASMIGRQAIAVMSDLAAYLGQSPAKLAFVLPRFDSTLMPSGQVISIPYRNCSRP